MGKKPRTKMPIEQRAKQFAPFQSVGGLDAALRRAEEEHRKMLESKGTVTVTDDELSADSEITGAGRSV